jgi:hypothetical protein
MLPACMTSATAQHDTDLRLRCRTGEHELDAGCLYGSLEPCLHVGGEFQTPLGHQHGHLPGREVAHVETALVGGMLESATHLIERKPR